jgi:hypothetical protein
LFELGQVVAAAFNDPKELKKLDPTKASVDDVMRRLESGEIPAMLKIPKKRSKAESNGG